MARPGAQRRQPALLKISAARALRAAAERSDALPQIKLASRFLALTAVRLAAVIGTTWGELEELRDSGAGARPRTGMIPTLAPAWRIPAARMKLAVGKKGDAGLDHLVPISRIHPVRAALSRSGEPVT